LQLLTVLCASNPVFVSGDRRVSLAGLLVKTLSGVSPGAQRGRLEALRLLCEGLDNLAGDAAQASLVPEMLAEVVLCVKSGSKKVRNAALGVMLALASRFADCGDGSVADLGGREVESKLFEAFPPSSPDVAASLAAPDGTLTTGPSLSAFLRMLIGALAAGDPSTQAGALVSLARVVLEHSERDVVQRATPRLVALSLLLLPQAACTPEVARAVMLLCRVALRVVTVGMASCLMGPIVSCTLRTPSRLRSKVALTVRNLLDVSVRRFGEGAVAPFVGAEDATLFKYVTKMRRRSNRKRLGVRAGAQSLEEDEEAAAGQEEEAAGEDFVGFGEPSSSSGLRRADGKFIVGGATAQRVQAAARKEQERSKSGNDRVFDDLLADDDEDAMAMTTALSEHPGESRSVVSRRAVGRGLVAEAASGKAWIRVDDENPTNLLDDRALAQVISTDPGSALGRKRAREEQSVRRSKADVAAGIRVNADGRVVVSSSAAELAAAHDSDLDSDDEIVGKEGLTRARRDAARASSRGRAEAKPTRRPDSKHSASAYKNRKAAGDALHKGQALEPYAFVPLEKKGASMVGKFESVTASTMGSRKASKRQSAAKRVKPSVQ
jgi:hypothetical protein